MEASRGQQPHPNVQSVQHPMDGGHHLVSGAAAVQPSPPFILAPPPVYQQVHHQQYQQAPQQGVVMGGEAYSSEPPSQQVQAFYGQQQQQHQVHHAPIVANNTGNAGGMVGGAVPPQPINPFEVCRVPTPPAQIIHFFLSCLLPGLLLCFDFGCVLFEKYTTKIKMNQVQIPSPYDIVYGSNYHCRAYEGDDISTIALSFFFYFFSDGENAAAVGSFLSIFYSNITRLFR